MVHARGCYYPRPRPQIRSAAKLLLSHCRYWRSYSPLLTRFRTVNPAFFASETESGFATEGELNEGLEPSLPTPAPNREGAMRSRALAGRWGWLAALLSAGLLAGGRD